MAATTTYLPGSFTAVAASDAWLLIEADPASAWLTSIWRMMGQRDVLASVLQVIDELGDAGPRNFACLAVGESSAELVVSGGAAADVTGGDTLQCPSSARRATYVLADQPEHVHLSLRAPTTSGATGLPVAAGIVSASALSVSWASILESVPAPPLETPPPLAVPAEPEPRPASTADNEDEPDVDTEEADADDEAEPEPEPAVRLATPAVFEAGEKTILPSDIGEPPPTLAADSGYDHLFGATINRSVEDAAVRAVEPVETHDDHDAQPHHDQPDPEPPPLTVAAPPLVAPTGGMIDNVPWANGNAQNDAPPPPLTHDAPSAEDRAAMTMVRSANLRPQAGPPPQGPSVRAVRCPAGHLNPPNADRCRVCTGSVAEQPPVTVPRPVLGILKLSTGGEITVDRSVLIGRSPSGDRLIDGQRPHMVKLPSPDQDISRNHVEVRIDGWHVLVSDLDSTNGTVVLKPGGTPERLRPNDPMMIEPGTVVTIADEVTFTYVAT